MRDDKPHSLREDAKKEYQPINEPVKVFDLRRLGVPDPDDNAPHFRPWWPPCNCGRYQCPKCQQQKEWNEAIDAEIERRKLKGQ